MKCHISLYGVITLHDTETSNETYEMYNPMTSLKLSWCSVNTFMQFYVSHFNRSRYLSRSRSRSVWRHHYWRKCSYHLQNRFFFVTTAIDYINFLVQQKSKQEEDLDNLRKEVMALKIMKSWVFFIERALGLHPYIAHCLNAYTYVTSTSVSTSTFASNLMSC